MFHYPILSYLITFFVILKKKKSKFDNLQNMFIFVHVQNIFKTI